ncbi:TPA_asm: hypothetical protein GZU98_14535 [Listeria monocytogenes]|nr:hypothetical protein [Listeria monocytogenes]HAC4844921.1 hypothetical protein [Listeria monocytogenes]HAC4850853.1 hypothetical protein [Listeria monocytogenes]
MKEKLIQFANRSKLEEFLALHKKRFLERKDMMMKLVLRLYCHFIYLKAKETFL